MSVDAGELLAASIPVDFCVALTGGNAEILCRLFFGSLFRTSNVSNVTFHLVDRGLPESDLARIVVMVGSRDYRVHRPKPAPAQASSGDVGFIYHWMVKNCGKNKWCILSHFDIMFKLDFVQNMRRRIRKDIGMMGQHNPIMMLNREAYRRSAIRFRDIAPFVAVRNPNGDYKLRFGGDRRIGGSTIPICGFDNGELLELELRSLGWTVEPLEEEFDAHFEHFIAGGSHYSGPQFDSIRNRAIARINAHGY